MGSWTVTAAGLTLGGADAGNYTLTAQPSDTSAITALGLTVSGFASDDKVYDGDTEAAVSDWGTLVGVVSGDTVTLDSSAATATLRTQDVGSWTVTAAGLTLGGADAGNYTLTAQPSDTSAITALGLTVSGFASDDKVYDGDTEAVVSDWGTLVGVVSGDTVTLDSSAATADFADANVGSWTVTAAGLTLGGADAGNYTLTAQPSDTSAITALGLTVSGFASDDKVYDGDTEAVVSAWGTLVGVVSGDTVTLDSSAATADFADANVGSWTVTAAGLVLGGADAGNYTLTAQPSDTSAITALALTVSGFASDDKVYDGDTEAVVSDWGTLVGVVSGDTVTLDSSAATADFADENVGSWTVTAAGLTLGGADAGTTR